MAALGLNMSTQPILATAPAIVPASRIPNRLELRVAKREGVSRLRDCLKLICQAALNRTIVARATRTWHRLEGLQALCKSLATTTSRGTSLIIGANPGPHQLRRAGERALPRRPRHPHTLPPRACLPLSQSRLMTASILYHKQISLKVYSLSTAAPNPPRPNGPTEGAQGH